MGAIGTFSLVRRNDTNQNKNRRSRVLHVFLRSVCRSVIAVIEIFLITDTPNEPVTGWYRWNYVRGADGDVTLIVSRFWESRRMRGYGSIVALDCRSIQARTGVTFIINWENGRVTERVICTLIKNLRNIFRFGIARHVSFTLIYTKLERLNC